MWKPLSLDEALRAFSSGQNIRIMTEEKAEMIRKIKVKMVHFAWDRYEDKKIVVPALQTFKDKTMWGRGKVTVFMLCNFDTTFEQDLERVYTIRDIGFSPYVMLYDKQHIPKGHRLRHLQRWVNSPIIFNSCKRFEDYKSTNTKKGA